MPEKSEHARLEAFCDGVFAIAITLLILDIKVPPIGSMHTKQEFWNKLLEGWPSWFGFFLSFVIILVAWVNHHNIFKLITKSSPQFIYANGLMLLSVVVLPFSTGLMSEYFTTDIAQPAITIYCFSILMHNVSWALFARAAMGPVSLFKDRETHQMFLKAVWGPVKVALLTYISLCILSFWFPLVAMCIMTCTWAYWVYAAIAVNPARKKRKE